nr:hypothetical protein [Tanacetum cinerariifolium]
MVFGPVVVTLSLLCLPQMSYRHKVLSRGIVGGEYGNCMLAEDVRGGPEIRRGQMVLDFENRVVHFPGSFGYNDVRALDDPYGSFFRQTGSVWSQGESSSARYVREGSASMSGLPFHINCEDGILFSKETICGTHIAEAFFPVVGQKRKLRQVFSSPQRKRGRSRKTPNSGVAINGVVQDKVALKV